VCAVYARVRAPARVRACMRAYVCLHVSVHAP